ncbi:hypothetical protein OHB49_45070 (plasmid) [Streptomyces sp. NBC_01717]|uniref:hypothetical protein n=1 Tax=Streptomyces sp. NBC_01717 TaxID=2975918 RepID=UPI002E331A35|nr:hypothetical protein [Streptomyces sp. NBC_01717]
MQLSMADVRDASSEDLGAYLTTAECAEARIASEILGPILQRQFSRRLSYLRRHFDDRPRKAREMRAWLPALDPCRLRRFAELSAFEAAAPHINPDTDFSDWQFGWNLLRVYPGEPPQQYRPVADQLRTLGLVARRRSASGDLPSPVPAQHPPSPRIGRARRVASRPTTTLASSD